ncbi:MAG TPA: 2-oxoglutarate dehydrogenase, E2 component, dihydrolipoamide succinyltransferase [Phycicoccus sp.]|nr:2-oxoglutarate dehydrogenase, E2 component, dihydrolipoamide succinyltransferase [Phycicoccus sp.]HQY95375.1 2-oxoglutarate dehydrogenase, E2 component, dihydrolipoamide succinyltransferase [Phycicoccus sp.]HRA43477.1 2-oxoglutarate dehydrogenase, E2 component, dihydrolipoamide succinyltransferase [Phycicoccus sp.]
MSERVTMPALGESVTEGTVTRWLKGVGDRVEVDEPLLEVSTDKVDTEIPSPVAGVIEEILVQEDETANVGADLVVIGDGSGSGSDGGDAPAAAEPEQAQPSAEQAAPAADNSGDDNSGQSGDGDAIDNAQDSAEVADAGDQGGQEPAQPQAASAPAPSSGGGEVSGGTTVTMPALGESVTEGTVTRWLKAEGDEVAMDEPLLEVSTDKVDTEIPSPAAGTLTKILVAEDSTVAVGADLAIIGGEAGPAPKAEQPSEAEAEPAPPAETQSTPEPAAAPAPAPEPEPEPEPEPAQEETKPEPAAPAEAPTADTAPAPAQAPQDSSSSESDADASAYVTPLVRKLAADHGIDLSSLKGTGIGGRIRKQDVMAAAEAAKAPEPAAAPQAPAASPASATAPAAAAPASTPDAGAGLRGTTQTMSRLRKVIAKRMVESLQVSAQLTTVVEVDVTKIARLRDRHKSDFEKREGTKLSFLPFFGLAAVEALKTHPTVNASIEGDDVTYHGAEHVGFAVDTPKGLLVPVVKNAGDLNIAGLARAIADVADRTRNNKITPDDLSGGTFTITNTGSRGALFDTPIINQPQVAILGTGAVVKRPVVVKDADGGETIAVRSMVYLALSYDHRIVDGADAARFLTAMKNRLEEGEFESSL